MAHFSYYFPFGTCPPDTVVPSGLFSQFDQNIFKAINGDDGGTWAPVNVITIGGAGLSITGAFNANVGGFTSVGALLGAFNGLQVGANGMICSGLAALSAITCSAITASAGLSCVAINASGGATVASLHSTGSAVVDGATTCSGTLTVAGAATFSGSTQCNGTLTTTANLNVAAGATFTAGLAKFSGNARAAREAISASAASGTLSPQAATHYFFPSTLAADAVWQISDTGAGDGDDIIVFNDSVSHTVSVNDPGGGLMITLKNLSGQIRSAWFKRITGSWVKIDVNHVP